MITVNQLFALLINCALLGSANNIDNHCILPSMVSTPYIAIPQDKNLPNFDDAYWYTFPFKGGIKTKYEILLKDDAILQAGVELVFNSDSLDSFISTFYAIYKLSKEKFGEVSFSHQDDIRTYKYSFEDKLFYLRTGRVMDISFIIFRAGNPDYYN